MLNTYTQAEIRKAMLDYCTGNGCTSTQYKDLAASAQRLGLPEHARVLRRIQYNHSEPRLKVKALDEQL